jgi:hypothetical protein
MQIMRRYPYVGHFEPQEGRNKPQTDRRPIRIVFPQVSRFALALGHPIYKASYLRRGERGQD